ncbi:thiamine pyrophosphate-dependent enzyme [Thermogemmatispora sp.]|uniref:thiamine pyrophosphate-dependent enzyme n=1 Tax=Thermogemmatispora sp. TaxID=1968838 RepID=UPI0035E42240
MLRAEALREIYSELERCVVVTIMGAVAAELYSLGHRPNFFYMEHSMGLASSLGLGLALSLPEQQVIVLDGDGSLLMNLGSLTTLARYRPPNLLHIVFDNSSLVSVGGFPTATASGTNLAEMARAAGVPLVMQAETPAQFRTAVTQALGRRVMTTLVARVEASSPPSYRLDLDLLENRFQFKRYLDSLRRSS